jgi:polyferredoxin
MNIINVRRITQVFFVALFLWFCAVTTLGDHWWQLRGWPVNWLLELDPLAAIGTLLTTRTVYAGLLWAFFTVALTILFGRFFCGWVCPFGALHQFAGWLGRRGKKHAEKVALNQHRRGQVAKYYVLIVMLAMAAAGVFARKNSLVASSLQTGLLDPIPLIHRSVNFVLLSAVSGIATAQRHYVGAWATATVFFVAVFLNLLVPRFYCRFICPLGALFGALARWTPWRIGKREGECSNCELCENNCEGACDPFGKIRISECLLCMNCLDACRQTQMSYGPNRSAAGEVESHGVTRRGFLVTAFSGVAAVPALRLGGLTGTNWRPNLVRPPGALTEADFLNRCIKCGQCMRVCPTNVLQPATLEAGLEGIWTPVLNMRIGTSGCQINCVACGNVCPTSAIRPLSLDEKLGRGRFEAAGPTRLGTAFVDRGRCLPWAMDTPCIVCQENCPVSPKAIFVREEFQTTRDGVRTVKSSTATSVVLGGSALRVAKLGTGDYFVRPDGGEQERRPIADNTADTVTVAAAFPWAAPPATGSRVAIEVRLQKPVVDPGRCVGCGVCEHECPVSGLRAIRVTAENESRNKKHSLTAGA